MPMCRRWSRLVTIMIILKMSVSMMKKESPMTGHTTPNLVDDDDDDDDDDD